MKAISLKQPFANFILFGWKTLETRTWNINYRGPLLICASQAIHNGDCMLDGKEFECLDVIEQWWRMEIPFHLGKALCVVDITDCREMSADDETAACCKIYPKAKVWQLENLRPVAPFSVKGQLNLFEVDETKIVYPDHQPVLRDLFTPNMVRRCRQCGCTDDDCSGCIERTGQPCHWVEGDLCSACAPPQQSVPSWTSL